MVTGWCGQPGPGAGVAPGRGQLSPATRPLQSPPKQTPHRKRAACLRPGAGSAGSRAGEQDPCLHASPAPLGEPALLLPAPCFHHSPQGPCLQRLLGWSQGLPAASAGCVGLQAAIALPVTLAGISPPPLAQPAPCPFVTAQLLHAGDVWSLGPTGPNPAGLEHRAQPLMAGGRVSRAGCPRPRPHPTAGCAGAGAMLPAGTAALVPLGASA